MSERRSKPGPIWLAAVVVAALAAAVLPKAADRGDASVATERATATPRRAAATREASYDRSSLAEPASRGTAGSAAGIFATTMQDEPCQDNWDCGSPPACDPYTNCDVDLYACVVSQKTGRGQCVYRGLCPICQPFGGQARPRGPGGRR